VSPLRRELVVVGEALALELPDVPAIAFVFVRGRLVDCAAREEVPPLTCPLLNLAADLFPHTGEDIPRLRDWIQPMSPTR
jgi:hypothetical protein